MAEDFLPLLGHNLDGDDESQSDTESNTSMLLNCLKTIAIATRPRSLDCLASLHDSDIRSDSLIYRFNDFYNFIEVIQILHHNCQF